MCTGVEWEWNEMTRSRDNTQLRGTWVTALCFTGSLTLRTGLWELTATLLTLNVALLVLPGKLAPQTSNDPHKDWNSHAFFFFCFCLAWWFYGVCLIVQCVLFSPQKFLRKKSTFSWCLLSVVMVTVCIMDALHSESHKSAVQVLILAVKNVLWLFTEMVKRAKWKGRRDKIPIFYCCFQNYFY